ncbi:MAG: UDP-N-acetylmuramate dehydrogenase [Bacteroidetes bacterium]|nr:UDP-N-acetylmuramate dehydrogenase [Bacteroidota bacterium]
MYPGQHISLKPYNTFGIEAFARYFICFKSREEVQEIFDDIKELRVAERLVLGGGSNILLCGDFNGYVLKNEIGGIEAIHEDANSVMLKVGAGVPWHQLVLYAVDRDWGGIENLSLIPGSTGAAPMQNIGAYGTELKDVFHSLEAYHIGEKRIVTFDKKDCKFGYRESVFKHELKNQCVLLSVTLCLKKNPEFNIAYGAIQQELEKMKVESLSVKNISDAVIRIRSSKLPDPAKIGNAGSFFKNPSVNAGQFHDLKKQYPDLVGYENTDGSYKLAAGWLIEACGWKGYRNGDAGCYPLQALVLVNYGNASGKELLSLSEEIKASVIHKFSVMLEREVNVI